MTKTYAEICIKRAEKVAELGLACTRSEFLQAQIELANDMPELARRLKRAIDFLRENAEIFGARGDTYTEAVMDALADELEKPMEGEK